MTINFLRREPRPRRSDAWIFIGVDSSSPYVFTLSLRNPSRETKRKQIWKITFFALYCLYILRKMCRHS
ncbi:hypothetical protein V6Z11_A12G219200 [Gossypium hirsutum]